MVNLVIGAISFSAVFMHSVNFSTILSTSSVSPRLSHLHFARVWFHFSCEKFFMDLFFTVLVLVYAVHRKAAYIKFFRNVICYCIMMIEIQTIEGG